MKKANRFISLFFAVGLVVALLAGCGGKDTEAGGSRIKEIKAKGKLVVATGDYRPFEYHDEKTNKVVGYDIDIAQKIADKIGVPLEIKDMQFSSLIPTVQNGQADLVIAALYITDERRKILDLSDSYLDTGIIMATKKDSAVKTSKDLEGKKAGAKLASTSAAVIQEMIDKGAKIELVTYKTNEEALADLEVGRIDAAITDKLYQLQYNSTHPSLTIQDEILKEAQLGIGVKKGDEEFLKTINGVLKDLKDSGEAEQLYKKWIPAQQ